MSRRMSKQAYDRPAVPTSINEWIDSGATSYFVIRTVPIAPDARSRIEIDPVKLTVTEIVSLRCGCPKCHEDIEFRYVAAETPGTFAQDLADASAREWRRSREEVAKWREEIERPAKTAAMVLDAMEEWYAS